MGDTFSDGGEEWEVRRNAEERQKRAAEGVIFLAVAIAVDAAVRIGMEKSAQLKACAQGSDDAIAAVGLEPIKQLLAHGLCLIIN